MGGSGWYLKTNVVLASFLGYHQGSLNLYAERALNSHSLLWLDRTDDYSRSASIEYG